MCSTLSKEHYIHYNGIIERIHNTILEKYLANIKKVKNLTLYEGLSIITALYNDANHSMTKLSPSQIVFGNSASLNIDEINLNKERDIQNARDNIARNANVQNSKNSYYLPEKYTTNMEKVFIKGKGKPSPYSSCSRWRSPCEQPPWQLQVPIGFPLGSELST